MKYVLIPNTWLRTSIYTHESIFIYGLLQKNKTIRDQIVFNLAWLFESLNISNDNHRGQKRIRHILGQFQNDKLFDFGVDILTVNKSNLIFSTMTEIEDSYTQVLDYEFDGIHGYAGEADIYKLFCVFCNIKSRIDEKGYCYPSYVRIMEDLNIINPNSMERYLRILQDELGLILYDNPGTVIGEDGVPRQSSNTYVMNYVGNYKVLKDAINERRDKLRKVNIVVVLSDEVNKRRSLSMKKYWELKKSGGTKTELEYIKTFQEIEQGIAERD